MQNDDVIWSVIGNNFCSYKVKSRPLSFCRNQFNVSGLCNRTSCPLANAQYATIREEKGKCYLYMKVVERSHLPAKLWEKIELPANFEKALEQIDVNLIYWDSKLRNKCKQRLTRIHQYLIRMRRLANQKQKVIPLNKKITRREERREVKALAAANITKSIESELIQRLKEGTYGEIYNFSQMAFDNALKEVEIVDDDATEDVNKEKISQSYFEDDHEDDEDDSDEEELYRGFVEDLSESDCDDIEDTEMTTTTTTTDDDGKNKKKKGRSRKSIEIERTTESSPMKQRQIMKGG
ncbi:hypothetical protein SNEBB_001291 [Seison nebaliae]|nr:hypothetical protein SNEBB_001291 [Seison nebaliae]